jgi:hypothetical protein
MDRTADLLKRTPGPVTLRASRLKLLTIAAAGALFTAYVTGQIIDSGGSVVDWFGVAFFGVGTAATIAMVFVPYELTLDNDGFTTRAGWVYERWRWVEVGDFAVTDFSSISRGPRRLSKCVGFNDRRPNRSDLQRMGERMYGTMTGRDRVLSDASGASSYGLPFEDLARLMSRWQELALKLSGNAV